MRLASADEIECITRNTCPFCKSLNVQDEVLRTALDSYCNGCNAAWSQYKDGKICIWKVGT